ncbi:MAG TPA: hypothetical protein VM889_12920 [Candidatus Thermoplasmatota archaeon]|nr:hypothetical protein [Candidatus Thermoplasmatota archaeon]
MDAVSPEMVLGKEVRNVGGVKVGAVVDVGLHDMRRVKFLVIEDAVPERFVRVDIKDVSSVSPTTVTVRVMAE